MVARLAAVDDIAALVEARFDYFAAEKWEITNEMKKAMGDQLLRYFSRHLNFDFFAALVEDGAGKIVSTAFLVVLEKPANLSFPTGRTGLILNVLTYPEHRNKGYATETMNMLIDVARRQNLSYLELSASEMGKPLYEKLGFQEPGPSHYTEMRMQLI